MTLEYTPQPDVNTSAAVESSPTVVENSAPAPAPEPSLAEALKTETAPVATEHEKHVPYERFQEVVKARQELEAQLQSQAYADYQKIDQALQKDPALGQVMMEAMAAHYRQSQIQQQQALYQQQFPNQQQPQPQAPMDPLQQTQMALIAQQQQLQHLMGQHQEATYNRYVSDFDRKVSASNVSDHWKPVYRNAVEQMVGSMNPNALGQYDGNLIAAAFDRVHQQIQSLQRAERAAYVADKTRDNMPPSTSGTGATPRIVSGDNTPDGRRNELLELMLAQQG